MIPIRSLWLAVLPVAAWCQGFPSTLNPSRTGLSPTYVASADFDRDGIPDLATANIGFSAPGAPPAASIGVVLGARSSQLGAVSELPALGTPFEVIALDVNRDGAPDIVAVLSRVNTSSSLLCSYLGNGRGGFSNPLCSEIPGFPGRMTAADFNGDGVPDLAAVRAIDNSVVTWLGAGDGSFRQASTLPVAQPMAVAAGDFNGDGISDLMVHSATGSLTVAQGDRQGGVRAIQTLSASPGPAFAAAGDLNRDGRADLVLVSIQAQNVSVYLSTVNGLASPRPLPVTAIPSFVRLFDADSDGDQDVWVATQTGVLVLVNDGAGTLSASLAPLRTGGVGPFVLGDFNADGLLDVVAVGAAATGNTLIFLAGRPVTTLVIPESAPSNGIYGSWPRVTVRLCAMPDSGTLTRGAAGAEIRLLRDGDTIQVARLEPGGASGPGQPCGPGPELGRATFNAILPVGEHTLSVFFPGGAALAASTSPPIRITVAAASTFLRAPRSPIVVDREQPVFPPVGIETSGPPVAEGTARLSLASGELLAEAPVAFGTAQFRLPGGLPVGPLRVNITFSAANYLGSDSGELVLLVQGRALLGSAARPSPAIAPESQALLVLAGLSVEERTAPADQPLPDSLSGVIVEAAQLPGETPVRARLLSIAPERIQFVVPAVAPGARFFRVVIGGETAAQAIVPVLPVAPAIFTADGSGSGVPSATAALRRADGTSTPVPVSDCSSGTCVPLAMPLGGEDESLVVALSATGLRFAASVTASAGSAALDVLSFGPHPVVAGLDQVNVRIPRGTVSGAFDLVLTADGAESNAVRLIALN